MPFPPHDSEGTMNSTFEIRSSVYPERTKVSAPNGPLLASLDDRGITFSLAQDPSTMDPMSRALVIGAFHGLGTTMSLAPVFVPFSKVETVKGLPEFWFRSEEDLEELSEEDANKLLDSDTSEPSVTLVYKNDNGERVELCAHCEADDETVELYRAIHSKTTRGRGLRGWLHRS
jgi:hypothetical protein